MTIINLIELIKDEETAIKWCQDKLLLNKDPICYACGNETVQYQTKYRCKNYKCRKIISITSCTIFHNVSIPIRSLIFMIYFWCCEMGVERTAFQLGISTGSVSNWFGKIRDYVSIIYYHKHQEPIGGEGKIVEIDEALIVKNKYHRGRLLQNQIWIIGGVVRGETNDCFIEFVENRSRQALVKVINERVAHKSIVMTDSWSGYNNLSSYLPNHQIQHFTVNHSKNFINPLNNEWHTQSIESFWSLLKRKIRQKGTNHGNNMDKYLTEILYRRLHGKNDDILFDHLITDISET